MNKDLRDHVTSVGFNLTLGKTLIAALVWLNETIQAEQTETQSMFIRKPREGHNVWGMFITGADGLRRRGLVEHRFAGDNLPMSAHWKVTRAGHYVIGLLREAGLYQEYADQLPKAQSDPRGRSKVG